MMVVDSSALVAILLEEPEATPFLECLGRATNPIMSGVSVLEASMVALGRLGEPGLQQLHSLIKAFSIRVIPFDQDQAVRAVDAFRRYGKGRHPAALNMGDCASYALASSHSLPLLYKGADFANTDAANALTA